MSELVLQSVVEGPLLGVTACIAGAAVVLGADAAALATFVGVAAGARAPRRGHVLLDGGVLHASPELRRVTATVLADESLPAFGSVREAIGAVLAARGDGRAASELLRDVGLGAWETRRSRDLDASERRTLLLALALTHTNPRLLVLFEPLASGRGLPADFVRERMARAVETGAVVVTATQSIDDARSLGGEPWLLDRGVLTNARSTPIGSHAGDDRTFVVETPDARRLTAALARAPDVRGVRWNERLAPSTVYVFGSDPERVASAIVRALSEESARVHSLALSPTPLEALVPTAHPLGVSMPYGQGAAPAYPSYPATVGQVPAAPAPMAAAPPDQSVSMPTGFADPTRPPGGGGS